MTHDQANKQGLQAANPRLNGNGI